VRDRSVIFWDFDGVIKESVAVKTGAYIRLFEPFGPEVADRVRQHHECNGGMSRFEKIPLYLAWSGRTPDGEEVARYCAAFGAAVRQAVIDSAWVPGAREYLEANNRRQRFVIVTATPQDEMEEILKMLHIGHWFWEVHGAPTGKAEAIRSVLARSECVSTDALVIGDSRSDYLAASANGVPFLLRRTPLNRALQSEFHGAQCEDFVDG
jgi:HAD superfamily hydrolase (TIGR01549 family)